MGMEEFRTLESNNKKTIVFLEYRRGPRETKKNGDKIGKKYLCTYCKQHDKRLNVGGALQRVSTAPPNILTPAPNILS